MIYKMFSVFDSKAEVYMRPFVAQTVGAAVRGFSDEVNSAREDSQLSQHPEDFALFELGSWDELSGAVEVLEPARCVSKGLDLCRKETKV